MNEDVFSLDDVPNPHSESSEGMDLEIQVQRPRHECVQVGNDLLLFTVIDHGLKIDVGDEDDRTFVIERSRINLLTTLFQSTGLRMPSDVPNGTGVKSCLEKVERRSVEEHIVSIVNQQNVTGRTVIVQLLVQIDRRDGSLEMFKVEPLRLRSLILENPLKLMSLPDTGSTGHDHTTNRTRGSALSELGHHVIPILDVRQELTVRPVVIHILRRGEIGELLELCSLTRTTTLCHVLFP